MPGAPLLFMGAEIAPWTEWNDAGGLPWHLLEHAAAPRRARPGRRRSTGGRASGRRCGSATTSRPGSSGSTPTTPSHSVYAFLRWGHAGAQAVACVANFTPVPRPGLPGRAAMGRGVAGAARHRRRSVRRQRLPRRASRRVRRRPRQPGRASRPRPCSTCRRSAVRLARRARAVIGARRRDACASARRRRSSRPASRSASAVGVFGVSFGVGAVAPGATVVADLRDVAARVHRRVAVLRGQRDRRRRLDGVGARRRAAARGAQRRLRADDVAVGSTGSLGRTAGRRAADDRRVDGDGRPPRTTRRQRDRRSGSPASASTSSGTSARCSARSPAVRSTRRRSASTPRSRRRSSPCCGRCCATAAAASPRALGAVICLVLIPFAPDRRADPVCLAAPCSRLRAAGAADDVDARCLVLAARRVLRSRCSAWS